MGSRQADVGNVRVIVVNNQQHTTLLSCRTGWVSLSSVPLYPTILYILIRFQIKNAMQMERKRETINILQTRSVL